MTIVHAGMVQAETGFFDYKIPFSIWLDGSADYLSRTLGGSPTDQNVWSFSCWAKRTALSTAVNLLGHGGAGDFGFIGWNASDQFIFFEYNGQANVISTPLYRDLAGWYHVVVGVDTDQGTASNRMRAYINGIEITDWGTTTYPSAAAVLGFNTNRAHAVGAGFATNGALYEPFPGYMSEVHFVDGQQLTPSNFGEFKNGIWVPKEYTGSHGANGFYLPFDDSAELGDDESGNGNDFTPTSLSAASQSTDTPTNNVATWDYLVPDSNGALSNGNRTYTTPGSGFNNCFSTIGMSAGKWHFEATVGGSATSAHGIGVGISRILNGTASAITLTGFLVYDSDAGAIYEDGSSVDSSPDTYASGDRIAVEVDFDNETVEWFKNGVSQVVHDMTGKLAGYTWFAVACDRTGVVSFSYTAAFAEAEFTDTPTGGFKALACPNLPEPPSASWPYGKVLETTLYTGDGTAIGSGGRTISGLEFQPGAALVKTRNAARSWRFVDAVRGVTESLYLDGNNGEVTESEGLNSFNADGFTVGSSNGWNASAETHAAYSFALGTAHSGMTTGSGTPQAYAGEYNLFNGVAFIGFEGNGTAGHTIPLPTAMTALYGAPKMIVVKRLDTTSNWNTWHEGLSSADYYVVIDLNNAQASSGTVWNSTAPSSSVVTLGSSTGVNASGGEFLLIAFWEVPGFSKALIYEGNAAADGAFVNCGFRPGWVLIKNCDAAQGWHIFDHKREGYNFQNDTLGPDAASAENNSANAVDLVSNGIKLRSANTNYNANTMIGWAFAEQPGKYANAR